MRRKSAVDVLAKKRVILVARTALALDVSEDAVVRLLRTGRTQSLRLNPLAADVSAIQQRLVELGWHGEQYSWLPEGYTIASGGPAVRTSDLLSRGEVYIQNAASWLPVVLLHPQPGERILDVCAAPGGKTTHIAAMANNKAHITANDNSRPRLVKLQAVCKQLHANIERFTLFDARQLARKLEGEQFDKILLDAPCSGEGMMHFDADKDFATWSVAHIKRLQQLQKQIIRQAWGLLAPGGTLVYSTCTMAPEENEAVVDYLLRSCEDCHIVPIDLVLPNRTAPVTSWNGRLFSAEVQGCLRLSPSEYIEAFFVCVLQKK